MSPYSTYDYKQVLADYDKGRITPEMAVGHSLQHIGKLYEALTTVNASRSTEQVKVDTLEKRVNRLQVAVDRLTAVIEKMRAKRNPSDPNQPRLD